jgi:hypothetical protein
MKRVLLGVVALLLVLSAGAFGYLLGGQYEADWSQEYSLTQTSFGHAKETESKVGVIVYGGGKVDSLSYAYLTKLDANVFLVDFPFQLAVFGINKGNEVMRAYPTITQWIVVGHSLGGSMGYVYLNQAIKPVAGIVYLASYPTGPSTIPTLALFGSADGLIDASEHQALFLPREFVVLEGANHAQFGEYGPQAGDQVAQLSASAQRAQVLASITEFIESLQTQS